MNLSNICTVTATLPPRILVHGQEGTGKTTLAARFPAPIFLQTEDGVPGGLQLMSFGLLAQFSDVRSALAVLATEDHGFRTVVVDSLDKLEGLIWADVCATRHWPSIEAPGYGKGYVEVDIWWRDVLSALDYLRRERGMIVLLIAHSEIMTINDPRTASYTSYQLRLHKRARGLVLDEMDVVAFLATELVIHSENAGFNKTRNRADGGSTRWLHFEGKPAFVAKNRYGLPAKMQISRDFEFGASLASYLPPARTADVSVRQTSRTKGASHHVHGIS
jgi:hypothetical protein